MISFLLNLTLTIVMVVLGGIILIAGRRSLWATLGIVALAATANLLVSMGTLLTATNNSLVELIPDYGSVQALIKSGNWFLILFVFAMGALGVYIGLNRGETAVPVLGFLAGGYMALWFDDIIFHMTNETESIPNNSALLFSLLVVLIGGLIGMYLTKKFPDEALILIAVFVGVDTIRKALDLSPTSIWTAIIVLSLALFGVVVQYADYLRELKGKSPLADPQSAMVDPPITELFQ